MDTANATTNDELPITGGPGKLYALAVVALAVFLLGLIAWHEPIRGYPAAAVVAYQRPLLPGHEERSNEPARDIAAALLSEGSLQHVVDELQLAPRDAAGQVDAAARTALIQRLRPRISVDPVRGAKPGETLIAIHYLGGAPGEGVRVVDALVRDFVQLHHGGLDDSLERRQMEEAEKAVAAAATAAKRAKKQMNEFLAQHLAELKELPRETTQPSAPPVTPTPSTPVATPTPPPAAPPAAPAFVAPAPPETPTHPPVAAQAGPPPFEAAPSFTAPPATPPAASATRTTPRAELAQRIAMLKAKQEELAAQRTWADAEVRAMSDEIGRLESELRKTPFDPLAPPTPVPTPPALEPPAAPNTTHGLRGTDMPVHSGRVGQAAPHGPSPITTAPMVARAEEAKAARLAALRREFDGLRKHHDLMQERWNQAVALQQKAAAALPTAPRVAATIVEPVHAAGQLGGGVRAGIVVWWGMASLLVGVFVAAFAAEPDDACPLLDAGEVTARLELPIVGRLAIGAVPREGAVAPTPLWTWWSVRAAEMALVGMALFLAVRLVGDSPLAARFIGDPLGAFADAWRVRG